MPGDVIYIRHRIPEYQEFQSPTGMTGRWLAKEAQKVAHIARLEAPKPGSSPYATGETAGSIVAGRPRVGRSGPVVDVSSVTDHAQYVHDPTPPHFIRPRRKTLLKFFSPGRAQMIYTKIVRHPGTKGNPFLLRALQIVFGGPGR